jgi:hypothetical protein
MQADAARHAAQLKELVLQQLRPAKIMDTDFTPVKVFFPGLVL